MHFLTSTGLSVGTRQISGSTGSGKSTAVANILGVISDQARFKSARVVLFDIHGEYAKAFGNLARVFRVEANVNAGERELHVPFWALTAEEFTSIAMGSVSGVPLTLVHEKLLAAKKLSKPGGIAHGLADADITVDTPLPFSVVLSVARSLLPALCNPHRQFKPKPIREHTEICGRRHTPKEDAGRPGYA